MKVIAFNGSPRQNGNTVGCLNTVLGELEKNGIETELIQVGKEKVRGCLACYTCMKNQNERCAVEDDPVNDWIQTMKQADGILLGSPVHFSGVAGTMKSFLDRAFFVASVNGGLLHHKVGASVAAVRRSGGIPAIDTLNHYIQYSEMIMPGSNYWNVAHGMDPGEMEQDGEGKQIMEVLGRNMAWLLKVMEVGKKEVPTPAPVDKTRTNFIR
ncbi:MAG: flavodoxin family protein [Deltaproteobacteria bacterium]|jgi:multimeric flavodoxin WrbA|nr:flavodoxin family protein [Deltaproteobacteria bacterium]